MKYDVFNYEGAPLGRIEIDVEKEEIIVTGDDEQKRSRLERTVTQIREKGITIRVGGGIEGGVTTEITSRITKVNDEYVTLLMERLTEQQHRLKKVEEPPKDDK